MDTENLSLISTHLSWDDLVLDNETLQQVVDLKNRLKQSSPVQTRRGLKSKLKKGYRVLFTGTPGTGKTLTAALLGKETGMDVYKVDLSRFISKYIGETEKNLALVFDHAEKNDQILFFDEADALFGKRTGVKDSHDKYANLEVGYLLQQIEEFSGLVILATNLKTNLDDAFTRRFQSVVRFQ